VALRVLVQADEDNPAGFYGNRFCARMAFVDGVDIPVYEDRIGWFGDSRSGSETHGDQRKSEKQGGSAHQRPPMGSGRGHDTSRSREGWIKRGFSFAEVF